MLAHLSRRIAWSRSVGVLQSRQMSLWLVIMNTRHSISLRAAIAGISVSLASCAALAAQDERILVPQDSAPASGSSTSAENAALASVSAARLRADSDPSALEAALIALGDAYASSRQYPNAVSAFNEALQLAEQRNGFESEQVLAPLLGLATGLADWGHHREAVPRLQRALAIQRAQYGVFDPRQQDTLKVLARSLTALDQLPEAEQQLIYRARVAEKTYGAGRTEVMLAMCDLGDWFAEVGRSLEARTTFLAALNIGAMNGPAIVEPLQGIARTRMRAQSYPRPWPAHETNAVRFNAMGQPLLKAKELNEEGQLALARALKMLEDDASASTREALIETLIQMGDWYQVKKWPRKALPYYERAWQQIRTARDPQAAVATALDAPVRVYYPTPSVLARGSAARREAHASYVQIELTVAADGSVPDARVVDENTTDQYVQEILNAVRASSFRPKFVDGKPVAVHAIAYREVF